MSDIGAEPDTGVSRERLAERVGSAAYGSILVLSTLVLVRVSDVVSGHAREVVIGVGAATWIAHLFADLLAEHVRRDEPLTWTQLAHAARDGSPILMVTVLPAIMLILGGTGLMSEDTARTLAIVVALGQLSLLGAIVGRYSPANTASAWTFAGMVAAAGIVVVALEVALSH